MSTTVNLPAKEDRRVWRALTRCADTGDDRPTLAHVMLDGDRAYATDGIVLAAIDAAVDLPDLIDDDAEEVAPRERVIVDARLLRDAIAMAKGDTLVRLRLEDDHLAVILGDDPLPLDGIGGAPTVTLPYGDADTYPPTDSIRRNLEGPAGAALVDEDVTAAAAGEVVTRLGVNADSLARLAAVAYRSSSSVSGMVTIVPRPAATLEVRNATTGERLGVMARVRELDELSGHVTRAGDVRSVTITSQTADTLAKHLDGEEEPTS